MINFFKYLEHKILFFEDNINYFYDTKTKKFYPIINDLIMNSAKNKIEREGLIPKIQNSSDYLIKVDNIKRKDRTFTALVKKSSSKKDDEKNDEKKLAHYIKIDKIFFPIIKENEKIVYINKNGEKKVIEDNDLKSYEIINSEFNNYYITLKDSKGNSNSKDIPEINELEAEAEAEDEENAT